ncbi:MAG: hypothetical protein K6356_11960 [Chloroflexus sp.]
MLRCTANSQALPLTGAQAGRHSVAYLCPRRAFNDDEITLPGASTARDYDF